MNNAGTEELGKRVKHLCLCAGLYDGSLLGLHKQWEDR